MLAKNLYDNACVLEKRGAHESFASKLAPTDFGLFPTDSICQTDANNYQQIYYSPRKALGEPYFHVCATTRRQRFHT